MSFAADLRAASADVWEAQHAHPFVRGIGDGTLEVGIDILRFFRGCLVRHVRTHDHALAGHLAVTTAASATAPATAPGAVRTPGGRTRAA